MDQEPLTNGTSVTLSLHTCLPCGVVVPRTVPVFVEEPSGSGRTMRVCPRHGAWMIAEDPDRRAQALSALRRLEEVMVAWPADAEIAVSAEVDPREMLLLIVESDTGESTPLMQAVTVAPGDDGALWFWFVWAPGCHSMGPAVLHPIAPTDDTEAAQRKLSVMLALL